SPSDPPLPSVTSVYLLFKTALPGNSFIAIRCPQFLVTFVNFCSNSRRPFLDSRSSILLPQRAPRSHYAQKCPILGTKFSPNASSHRHQQWPTPKNRRRKRRLSLRAASNTLHERLDPRAKHHSQLFTCLTHVFVDARNLL